MQKADETTRVYFAVPGFYDIGSEHATFAEAVEAARATIQAHDFGGYSRAFVDVRCADRTGDRPLQRFEIFRAEVPA